MTTVVEQATNPFLAGVWYGTDLIGDDNRVKVDVLATRVEREEAEAQEIERQARTRSGITITKLNRDAGYWTARVTFNGQTIPVDRKHGSWQAPVGEMRREVMPHIAARLQDKVRPIEDAERRAAERAVAATTATPAAKATTS